MKPILVIAGPTAVGKSRAAIAMARCFSGEIVCADSIQVYRGFDIGSAKTGADELSGIPQHLVDVTDPDVPLDAARYAQLADDAIASIQARGRLPIVAGGSGLWLRALLRGLVPLPAVDPILRHRLESQASTQGPETLHRRLAEVDPEAASIIHPTDTVRIVRALEVFEQTGTPLSRLQSRHSFGRLRYPCFFIVLDLPHEELRTRIALRTRSMIDAGWADEVRSLLSRFGPHVRPFGSVGYRQMLRHVKEGVSLDETERLIVSATRLYARRQRTWFAKEACVDWRTTADKALASEGEERIAAFLR